MRLSSKIHIVFLSIFVPIQYSSKLKGQQQVELVPYSIIPLDPNT